MLEHTMYNSNTRVAEDTVHLLIADDDLEMRRMLRLLAEHRGFVVETVDSGDALVDRLLNSTPAPDVVITDVRMPGRSGLEALTIIRPHLPDLPAVVVTAFGDHTVHDRARSLGARCMNKPFDPDTLLDLVETMMEST